MSPLWDKPGSIWQVNGHNFVRDTHNWKCSLCGRRRSEPSLYESDCPERADSPPTEAT